MFSLLVSCTSLKNTTKEGGGGGCMMLPLDPSRLSFSLVGKEIKQTYDGRSGKMLTEIVFPT
jgi:hypothetical protein